MIVQTFAPTFAERAWAYVASGDFPPPPTMTDGAAAFGTWLAALLFLLSQRVR